MAFDPGVRIKGVILNNISPGRHLEKAKGAIEHYCGIPVIGAVPHTPQMELAMRHLGLVPYREGNADSDFTERIDEITRVIEEYIDMDALYALADEPASSGTPLPVLTQRTVADLRIGIAYDEAINFYYADLYDLLTAHGAKPVFFSLIHDSLPDADGYILGGGYPELYGRELEENASMREAIVRAAEAGVPIYAECGGLMYLCRSIQTKAGWQGRESAFRYQMCGLFPGDASIPSRRVLGYVEGRSHGGLMGESDFRGHEFHYSEIVMNPGERYMFRLSRGEGIFDGNDGIVYKNAIGSYAHLHPVASSDMFASFLSACRDGSV